MEIQQLISYATFQDERESVSVDKQPQSIFFPGINDYIANWN